MTNEIIKQVYELKQRKEELERQQELIREQLNSIENELAPLEQSLVEEMTANNLVEYKNEGIVTLLFKRVSKGYTKEEEQVIIKLLKEKGLTNCISVKESLAKRELNKVLKTNQSLTESLSNYGTEKVSEYVVVTSVENATKIKEHINDGK